MQLKKYQIIFMLVFSCVAHASVYAGSQQKINFTMQELAPFAKQVEHYAAAKGAKVFFLARLGTARSHLPDAIQFTHTGLAVYSDITSSDGQQLRGNTIYNLYQKPQDLSESTLVTDYPVDFFAGAVELKAGIIIPTKKMQAKILKSLNSGVNIRLHNPKYSLISNPYSRSFQNCNEHILDIIFASIYSTEDTKQLKANQKEYFNAQLVQVSPFKRLLAPMLSSYIRMSDQGEDIQLVTFTTISKFLDQYGLAKGYAVMDINNVQEIN